MFELRPSTEDDQDFLLALYASVRKPDMDALGLDAGQAEAFLRMQYTARDRAWEAEFPDARSELVFIEGQAAGRIQVGRTAEEIRLIDIALLPEYRNQGVGAALIARLLDEARKNALPIRLHVERNNRAATFYTHLGFHVIADKGTHLAMEWP